MGTLMVMLFAALAIPLRMTVREMMRDHETDPTLSDIAHQAAKLQDERSATEQSVSRAEAKWPGAFVPGTPFHEAILQRKQKMEAEKSPILEDPLWPEILCAMVGGELGIRPVNEYAK